MNQCSSFYCECCHISQRLFSTAKDIALIILKGSWWHVRVVATVAPVVKHKFLCRRRQSMQRTARRTLLLVSCGAVWLETATASEMKTNNRGGSDSLLAVVFIIDVLMRRIRTIYWFIARWDETWEWHYRIPLSCRVSSALKTSSQMYSRRSSWENNWLIFFRRKLVVLMFLCQLNYISRTPFPLWWLDNLNWSDSVEVHQVGSNEVRQMHPFHSMALWEVGCVNKLKYPLAIYNCCLNCEINT